MTCTEDVLRQIETVLYDDEYSPVLGELLVIRRILTDLARRYAVDGDAPAPHMTNTEPENAPFFPGCVYKCLRDYEKHRQVTGSARRVYGVTCISP